MQNKRGRPALLSSSRPPIGKQAASLSSRATRALVRKHHTLRKQLKHAKVKDDEKELQKLQMQITELGGLERYQRASIQGQAADRGGDSSKLLVEWLHDLRFKPVEDPDDSKQCKLRMLEVGALKVDNACARCDLFEIERIDLHSQHPSIKEQDFMKRPIPANDRIAIEGFDIVSLSLVLNFVEDAAQRGEMLKRVQDFLRDTQSTLDGYSIAFPSLFLVLPAPCILNSRYLDAAKFEAIMQSLGFVILRSKSSAKLIYYLFKYEKTRSEAEVAFKKEEVRSGKTRNNFAVVVH